MVDIGVYFDKEDIGVIEGISGSSRDKFLKACKIALERIRSKVVDRTPIGEVTTSRNPGNLRASWSEVQHDGNRFYFDNDAPYASVVEAGLYPGVGPRTVESGEGIYSRQTVDAAGAGMIEPVVSGIDLEEAINVVLRELEDSINVRS